jgi:hypothetical protein
MLLVVVFFNYVARHPQSNHLPHHNHTSPPWLIVTVLKNTKQLHTLLAIYLTIFHYISCDTFLLRSRVSIEPSPRMVWMFQLFVYDYNHRLESTYWPKSNQTVLCMLCFKKSITYCTPINTKNNLLCLYIFYFELHNNLLGEIFQCS